MAVGLWVAFFAGLVSFVSPCVLPLIPTYVLFLTGQSAIQYEHGRRQVAWGAVFQALLFVLGFGMVFVAFGLTASAFGHFLNRYEVTVREVAGIIVVVMGLQVAGLIQIPGLSTDRSVEVSGIGRGGLRSLLVGMAFSAGWTACIGPILASILLVAAQSTHMWTGALLLATYSLGLGLPFLAVAAALGNMKPLLRRVSPYLTLISQVSGGLLVVLGVMLYTGVFARLSALFSG